MEGTMAPDNCYPCISGKHIRTLRKTHGFRRLWSGHALTSGTTEPALGPRVNNMNKLENNLHEA